MRLNSIFFISKLEWFQLYGNSIPLQTQIIGIQLIKYKNLVESTTKNADEDDEYALMKGSHAIMPSTSTFATENNTTSLNSSRRRLTTALKAGTLNNGSTVQQPYAFHQHQRKTQPGDADLAEFSATSKCNGYISLDNWPRPPSSANSEKNRRISSGHRHQQHPSQFEGKTFGHQTFSSIGNEMDSFRKNDISNSRNHPENCDDINYNEIVNEDDNKSTETNNKCPYGTENTEELDEFAESNVQLCGIDHPCTVASGGGILLNFMEFKYDKIPNRPIAAAFE